MTAIAFDSFGPVASGSDDITILDILMASPARHSPTSSNASEEVVMTTTREFVTTNSDYVTQIDLLEEFDQWSAEFAQMISQVEAGRLLPVDQEALQLAAVAIEQLEGPDEDEIETWANRLAAEVFK